jgi:CBS domain-containing protein
LVREHVDLYQGYVRHINEIEDRLESADRSHSNSSYAEISELHRRQGTAYNGAYLHQLFFENLTPEITMPSGELRAAIEHSFGTLEDWGADMRAALDSGPGWVLLMRSKADGSLRNAFVQGNDEGVLVEHDILLAIDGWEHAYTRDYGSNRTEYAQVIESHLDWGVASRRFAESLDETRARARAERFGLDDKLRDVMTQAVETIAPGASITEAAQRMRERDIGALPVVDRGLLRGIVTDRDLVIRGFARANSDFSPRVQDVMSTPVHACHEEQSALDALTLMESRKIRRVPVLERETGRLVGIVSLGDLATEGMDESLSGSALERISGREPAA